MKTPRLLFNPTPSLCTLCALQYYFLLLHICLTLNFASEHGGRFSRDCGHKGKFFFIFYLFFYLFLFEGEWVQRVALARPEAQDQISWRNNCTKTILRFVHCIHFVVNISFISKAMFVLRLYFFSPCMIITKHFEIYTEKIEKIGITNFWMTRK